MLLRSIAPIARLPIPKALVSRESSEICILALNNYAFVCSVANSVRTKLKSARANRSGSAFNKTAPFRSTIDQSGFFLICANFLGKVLGVPPSFFIRITVRFSSILSPLTFPQSLASSSIVPASDAEPQS